MRRDSTARRPGLTLVEVIVVIAILGVMAALAIPASNKGLYARRRAQCAGHLGQIGLAIQGYHSAFNALPPGYVSRTQGDSPTSDELGPGWRWCTLILNQLDEADVFNAINLSLPITDPAQKVARAAHPMSFTCPSSSHNSYIPDVVRDASGAFLSEGLAQSHFVAVAGQLDLASSPAENNGLFYRNSRIRLADIHDGLAQTLMVGERSPKLSGAIWLGVLPSAHVCTKSNFKPVLECLPSSAMVLGFTGPDSLSHLIETPISRNAGPGGFYGLHADGCHFAFADGSVRLIHRSVDARIFGRLATRAGGEEVSTDDY